MLKHLPRTSHRDFYFFTKSAPEQNTDFKFTMKEEGEEITPSNDYDSGIIYFVFVLGSSKSK